METQAAPTSLDRWLFAYRKGVHYPKTCFYVAVSRVSRERR